MTARTQHLQRFLDEVGSALEERVAPADPPAPVVGRILGALRRPATAGRERQAEDLSVLRQLPAGLSAAAEPDGAVAAVGQALADLAPGLDWRRRPQAAAVGPDFFDGHANAVIVGADGLEQRNDVTVGVSLVAPGVRYPDHCHPPEEVYLVLSPGEWWQAGGAWHAPGIGGIVHNPPGIMHAMRAGTAPLLAVWLLWMED